MGPLSASRATLWAIAAIVLSALWPGASRAQNPLLGARLDFAVGSQPLAVASGDLNGDGNPDLVTANSNANTVSVLLGDGTGAFGAKTDYPVGTYPISVAIADLNGDGRPDLAVANYGGFPAYMSVLLGNGAGGFAPKVDVPAPSNCTAIAVGDLNGDGKPDVAMSNLGAGAVVLLGNGAGGFSPWTGYAAGINPYSIAIGDLSGDGKPDLVVGNYLSGLSVLLGNGTGGFAPKTDYPAGSGVYSVVLGDLNNDGKLDVVEANYGTLSSSVGVFLGDGAGGLGTMTQFVIGSDSRPRSVAIGDVNGDGKPDLTAALSNFYNGIEVLLGDGSGGFALSALLATVANPTAIAASDVNGDGQLDFAVASLGSDTVSVLLGNADGGFAAKSVFGTPSFASGIAIGDLNGDGRPDLGVGNNGGSFVSVLLANGSGGFGPHTDFATGLSPYSLAIGDLNGDGKPDVVAANHDPGNVSVLLGNGAGGFGPKADYTAGTGPYAVAIADFNGDGRPDVAVANTGSASVSILNGTGSGALAAPTNYAVGTNPYSIAVGDFNGDGRPDVVTANGGSGNTSVLLATPAGFGPATNFTTVATPVSVAIGDLNGDGKLDLVVLSSVYPWGVSVLLGNGAGSFAPKVDFPNVNGAYPWSVAVGDVNGDRRADVLITGTYYSTVDVLYGNGLGGLVGTTSLPTASGLVSIGVGDLNGDGRLDIAATSGSSVSVLLALETTRTSLTVSPGGAVLGAPLTLTANVAAVPPGTGAPAGTVSFFDGFTLLGTSPVNNGVAGLALFAPRLGSRPVTAVYNGDGKFQRSISPVRNVRVTATAGPALSGIVDIKNDQGRQVRVQFAASPNDNLGSAIPITEYEIYRQVNPALMIAPAREAFATTPTGVQVDGWDFVGSLTAHDELAYDLVVPTLADSNGAGIHRAAFFVRASTASPYVYFDSAPDSGYSVDNLAPAIPSPFTGNFSGGATHLHWGVNLEPDLWYYRLYRGSSAGFVPGPANLIATRADTGFADPGNPGSYYKLSAVDVNGNESGYAVLSPSGTVDVPGGDPFAFALEGARPNPVRGLGLAVHFTLPGSAPARLELIDVGGRRVAASDVGALGPGRHAIDLAAGRSLAPGLYLLRLTQGPDSRTARVAVLP